jgi:hypothetical protein
MSKYIYSGKVTLAVESALKRIKMAEIASYKVLNGEFFLTLNPQLSCVDFFTKLFSLERDLHHALSKTENFERKEMCRAGIKLAVAMHRCFILDTQTILSEDEFKKIIDYGVEPLQELFAKHDLSMLVLDDKIIFYVPNESIVHLATDIMLTNNTQVMLAWTKLVSIDQELSATLYHKVHSAK